MDEKGPSNWRGMFESTRASGRGLGGNEMNVPPPPTREEPPDDDALELDLTEYKPWVLQRGRSRPTMLLELRRFEAKSGMWMGWQLSYPHLNAVEFIGDKMFSLDFGTRQFVIEGSGLDELVRYLQLGAVMTIQEYAGQIWPARPSGAVITAINKITGK
jgi:hypothetical protein